MDFPSPRLASLPPLLNGQLDIFSNWIWASSVVPNSRGTKKALGVKLITCFHGRTTLFISNFPFKILPLISLIFSEIRQYISAMGSLLSHIQFLKGSLPYRGAKCLLNIQLCSLENNILPNWFAVL